MWDGRGNENGAVTDEAMKAREGQRTGVNAEGRRTVAGTAGFAEVIADGAGCGEKNDGKITLWRAGGVNPRMRVVGDEPLRNSGQIIIGGR